MKADLHPSDQILSEFRVGKLPGYQADSVRLHLEACPECRRIVDSFGLSISRGDTFGSSPSLSETGSDRPERSIDATDIPPELSQLQQYTQLRELGRGGMGTVYLARNTLMDRDEVLKIVNRAVLDRKGATERFLREIRSAAKLNHPNVVTAYAAQLVGELMIFSMEYVPGEDLAKLLQTRGPMTVSKACYYAYQTALGLQHAHERGMVHRDIKPSNLILVRSGRSRQVKILDFGLAKLHSEQSAESGLTGVGKILGTPDYMAPEQIDDSSQADIRADIYSLGCTLYCLLTGEPPFAGTTLYATLYAQKSRDATPLQEKRPDVSAELAAIVAKMMAKNPSDRFQSPGEVARALAPFLKVGRERPSQPNQSDLRPRTSEINPESKPDAQKSETPRPSKKWELTWGIFAAFGVGLGCLVAVVALRTPVFHEEGSDETPPGVPAQFEETARPEEFPARAFRTLFDGSVLKDFKPVPGQTGTWTLSNGVLIGRGSSTNDTRNIALLESTKVYKDFRLRVTLPEPSRDGKSKLIIFRAMPFFKIENYYCMHTGGMTAANQYVPPASLMSVQRGEFGKAMSGAKTKSIAKKIDIAPDQPVTLEVLAIGSRIQSFVNGESAAEFSDDIYASGYLRLSCRRGTEVRFQRIEIQELDIKPVISRFGPADKQGWTTRNSDGSRDATVGFEVRGSGSNYSLFARDKINGKAWGFQAPSAYLGNHADKFGTQLCFEMWLSKHNNAKRGDTWVRIRGNGQAMYLLGDDLPRPADQAWTRFRIPLDSSGLWRMSSSDVRATNEQIQNILGNITDLWIRGDLHDGDDAAGLDNVELGVSP